MAERTSGSGSGSAPKLFVRQSSGLVREVSVVNALFYNVAAFIGTGVGWYPVFYALAFLPVGLSGPFSSYGWAAVVTGLFGVVLGMIFASLATVMPRSGGDYVFTSRIIPRIGPFLGWLESFTLGFASLAVIAFEVPIILRDFQISGRIIGIGTGSSFFTGANGWFANSEGITGWPGMISSLVVLALVFLVVIQPTRKLHRIVTTLAGFGILSAVLMLCSLLLVDPAGLKTNLPKYAGVTLAQVHHAAATYAVQGHGVDFAPSVFTFFIFIVLFNYIGFQYSAYIAGEVRGNIKRGILIAVMGALLAAVLLNSVYVDLIARRLGFLTQVGWGAMFWSGDAHLPMGQPNSSPLVAAIASPHLWPLWLLINLGGTLLPFILIPVYINFLSRLALAWSLDRQVPEWFGEVNERLRAPVNAILSALGLVVVLTIFQNFPLLPKDLAPPSGKLNLVGTVWFSALTAILAWLMPGVNALVAPMARPDLIRNAPWRRMLPVLGVIWLVFGGMAYWFAGIKPIATAVGNALQPHSKQGVLSYLNGTGISFTLAIAVIGIIIFAVQWARNRAQGIDLSLLYHEIPPD